MIRCGELKDKNEFYDASLVGKYGRICKTCKRGKPRFRRSYYSNESEKNILQRDPQFTPSVVQKWFTTLVSMENFGIVVTFQDVAAHAKLDHEQINIRFWPQVDIIINRWDLKNICKNILRKALIDLSTSADRTLGEGKPCPDNGFQTTKTSATFIR